MRRLPDIRVIETPEHRFKVTINYIQEGIEYTNKDYARHEMEKIKQRYNLR